LGQQDATAGGDLFGHALRVVVHHLRDLVVEYATVLIPTDPLEPRHG
jgi:hypothetical protein